MAREWYETVANIIGDAAVELGLISTALSDPFASQDPNVIQLIQYLKAEGQELVRDYGWQQLQREHSFTTAAATPGYDMPSGFHRFIDQTPWNRTTQLPLHGPLSPQGWQRLKASAASGLVNDAFRIQTDQILILPVPDGVESIYFEYYLRFWVQVDPTGDTPDADAPAAAADVCWFDKRLLVAGTKYRFLKAKRMATQDDLDDYTRQLDLAKGASGASPVLSLNGNCDSSARLLDDANIPLTGYGS